MWHARKILAFSALASVSACGLLAGPVSDKTESDFDLPVLDDEKFTGDLVPDLESNHALAPAGAPTKLPIDVDTALWGPIIKAHLVGVTAGAPGIFRVVVEDLRFEAQAPVVVNLSISSRDGKVWGLADGTTPEDPRSCHFRLQPDATAEELGRRFTICAEDWVNKNGVPNELEMEIFTGGELPDGSQGLENEEFTVFEWKQKLHTDNKLEADCKVVTMDPDLVANGKSLDLQTAVIAGWGYSNVTVDLGAFAIVHDGKGKPRALGFLNKKIFAKTRYWIIRAAEDGPAELADYRLEGNVQPLLSPGMPRFPFAVVEGLAGTNGSGPGEGLACWWVYGDAPRKGGIGVTIQGNVSLKGFRIEDGE